MLKFTAKFNTSSHNNFEKVCSVLQNNGWVLSEEPVFMYGMCTVTISIDSDPFEVDGTSHLSQIIDAIECSDCIIHSLDVIQNDYNLEFPPFKANWETSTLPNEFVFEDESFEHPETGETVFAFRHIVTGEWMY